MRSHEDGWGKAFDNLERTRGGRFKGVARELSKWLTAEFDRFGPPWGTKAIRIARGLGRFRERRQNHRVMAPLRDGLRLDRVTLVAAVRWT